MSDAESAGRFGVTRRVHISDIDHSWLVVVIRPDSSQPEATARTIDTYKVAPSALPEDPTLVSKIAADLRDLADELEAKGWLMAFRSDPISLSSVGVGHGN